MKMLELTKEAVREAVTKAKVRQLVVMYSPDDEEIVIHPFTDGWRSLEANLLFWPVWVLDWCIRRLHKGNSNPYVEGVIIYGPLPSVDDLRQIVQEAISQVSVVRYIIIREELTDKENGVVFKLQRFPGRRSRDTDYNTLVGTLQTT